MPSLQRPSSPFSPTCHQIRTRVSTATSRVHCATTCGASMGVYIPLFSCPPHPFPWKTLHRLGSPSKGNPAHPSPIHLPYPLSLVRLHSLGSPSEGDPLIPPAPALWKAGCSGSTEGTLPHNLPTGPYFQAGFPHPPKRLCVENPRLGHCRNPTGEPCKSIGLCIPMFCYRGGRVLCDSGRFPFFPFSKIPAQPRFPIYHSTMLCYTGITVRT